MRLQIEAGVSPCMICAYRYPKKDDAAEIKVRGAAAAKRGGLAIHLTAHKASWIIPRLICRVGG